jgi:hypothetical protein
LTEAGILADLLPRLEPARGRDRRRFLSGLPPQERVGVGYETVYGLDVPPAGKPSLTVTGLDCSIDESPPRPSPAPLLSNGLVCSA